MEDELDFTLLVSCLSGLGRWRDLGSKKAVATDPTHWRAIRQGKKLVYEKTDDCVECLKDLQRFLRQDDPEKREAFFVLGQQNVSQLHLVPLLTKYPADRDIVYNAVKVATLLTMPGSEVDKELLQKQIANMQEVKEAFLSKDVLTVVAALVLEPLADIARLREEDARVVQLILALLRNLLCIPDRSATAGSRGDHMTRMTSDLLECLFESDVMELLLLMAQRTTQGRLREEAPLLVEVFCYIFKGVEPSQLLRAAHPPTAANGSREPTGTLAGLKAMLSMDKSKKRAAVAGRQRHARHGGTFVSMAGNHASLLRGGLAASQLPPMPCLQPRSKTLVRAEAQTAVAGSGGGDLQRRVLVRLRGFMDQFLDASYAWLMGSMQAALQPGLGISRLGRDDYLRFMQLAKLCTAYLRMKQEERLRRLRRQAEESGEAAQQEESPFAAISATMGWESFHMVQVLWLNTVDVHATSPEKDWHLQHVALSLLKEMLLTLDLALRAGSSNDRRAADRLSRRLLHDDRKESGLLPVMGRILKSFHLKFQPRSHAAEAVEAIHATLRLLEHLSHSGSGAFIVARQAGVRRRRPVAEAPDAAAAETEAGTGNEGSDEAVREDGSPVAEPGRPRQDPLEQLEQEEEDAERAERTREVAFNLNQRIRQELAVPAVLHLYCWLLRGYRTNGEALNHAIVSFLHRVCASDELDLEPMLYQLSALRVFEQILSDREFLAQPHAEELGRFCTQVTRRLFARLLPPPPPSAPAQADEEQHESAEHPQEAEVQANLVSMMFVELLFWKNQQEAEEVRDEYNWQQLLRRRDTAPDEAEGSPHPWPPQPLGLSSTQEAQLRELFEQHGMEKGHLDIIAEKLQGGFSRARVSRHLKSLGLKRGVLTAKQEARLRELHEEYGGKRGALLLITEGMPGAFSKSQISTQLPRLGLRKRKGDSRPTGSLGSGGGDSSGSDAIDHDSDAGSGDNDADRPPRPAAKAKKRGLGDWSDDDSASAGSGRAPARSGGTECSDADSGLGASAPASPAQAPSDDGSADAMAAQPTADSAAKDAPMSPAQSEAPSSPTGIDNLATSPIASPVSGAKSRQPLVPRVVMSISPVASRSPAPVKRRRLIKKANVVDEE